MDEIWKDIEGYEGLYQVSNLGRVKALPKYCFNGSGDWLMKERILKPHLSSKGYHYVCLYKNKQHRNFAIHRLVASAFILNDLNNPDIDHINTIKTDNRAENLRWATKTDNMNNPLTRKKISESKKGTPQPKGIDNKRSRTILQYTLDGKFIKEWHGSKEIARAFNGCNSFILRCCRGVYRQAYGYIWKFKEGD